MAGDPGIADGHAFDGAPGQHRGGGGGRHAGERRTRRGSPSGAALAGKIRQDQRCRRIRRSGKVKVIWQPQGLAQPADHPADIVDGAAE
jgi:hypothetical protein